MTSQAQLRASWSIQGVLEENDMTGERAPKEEQIHVLVVIPGSPAQTATAATTSAAIKENEALDQNVAGRPSEGKRVLSFGAATTYITANDYRFICPEPHFHKASSSFRSGWSSFLSLFGMDETLKTKKNV